MKINCKITTSLDEMEIREIIAEHINKNLPPMMYITKWDVQLSITPDRPGFIEQPKVTATVNGIVKGDI